jgi:hypothetical protein
MMGHGFLMHHGAGSVYLCSVLLLAGEDELVRRQQQYNKIGKYQNDRIDSKPNG